MPGVRCGAEIGDYNADGGVGAKVVDVPFWVRRVGDIAGFGEKEDRIVVIASEGGVIDRPDDVTCGVYGNVDGEVEGCAWRTGRDAVRGDRLREGVVGAGIGIVGLCSTTFWRGCSFIGVFIVNCCES